MIYDLLYYHYYSIQFETIIYHVSHLDTLLSSSDNIHKVYTWDKSSAPVLTLTVALVRSLTSQDMLVWLEGDIGCHQPFYTRGHAVFQFFFMKIMFSHEIMHTFDCYSICIQLLDTSSSSSSSSYCSKYVQDKITHTCYNLYYIIIRWCRTSTQTFPFLLFLHKFMTTEHVHDMMSDADSCYTVKLSSVYFNNAPSFVFFSFCFWARSSLIQSSKFECILT